MSGGRFGRDPYRASGLGGQPFAGRGHPGGRGGEVTRRGFGAPMRQQGVRSTWRTGLRFAVGYLVVIWAVHLVNVFGFGGALLAFGIQPLDLSSLWHIVTAPVLHVNFSHLVSNSLTGALFAFLVGCSGRRAFWEVTGFVVVIGGVGTWIFGGVGTSHVGASLLIYGWLAYLLVRGIFNRSVGQTLLGVLLLMGYSGLLWGVLPGVNGMSWQAHLFGALGGVVAAMMITSDDPPRRS